ncbi:hypothetical protein CFC21_031106 [Triticum aestivum]|uniref:Uncharacterized protein n=3 Tax=Triticum aestivum TaxID=4565 RepID=A0A3B6DGS0_WHEAT|nr:hypothetical protein CFC21_031106 [Triticum aestivum]
MRGTLLPPSSFDLDLGMLTSLHNISVNHYWMWRRLSTAHGLLAGTRVRASMRGASSSWTDRGNRWSQSWRRRRDAAAAAVSSEAVAAPRRPHQHPASAMSSPQDPFYIVREEIQGSMGKLQTTFHRWKQVSSNLITLSSGWLIASSSNCSTFLA